MESAPKPASKPLLDDDELSDEEVIAKEWKFRKRFGPGFTWNSLHRKALIELKHEKDLTDPEIRLFHWSGNLRRTPFGVTLSVSVWVALWGGVALAPFALLFLALLVAGRQNPGGDTLGGLRAGVAFSLLGAFCYGIYWSQIKPWRIKRRVDEQQRWQAQQ